MLREGKTKYPLGLGKSVWWRKKRKGKKEKERRKEGKNEKRERKRKEANGFFLSSPVFQQSEFVGPRSKVRLRDEGYAPRGRDPKYFGLFSTLRVVWWCLCLKGLFGQILESENATRF